MTVQEEIQALVTDIDRVLQELVDLRRRLARTLRQAPPSMAPSREWEAFGMWADREDMQGLTTAEWLEQLRARQWGSRG